MRLIASSVLLGACAAPSLTHPRALLDQVWETTRAHHFDPAMGGVDWAASRARAEARLGAGETVDAAIAAMLAELGTSHTARFTRDDVSWYVLLELFWEGLEPAERARIGGEGPPLLPGIGILTEEAEVGGQRGHSVRTLLSGGPAEAAGLRIGDRLLTVEGESFRPVASFREQVGRAVRVRVQRTLDPDSAAELVLRPEALGPRALFLRAQQSGARIFEHGGKRLAYVPLVSYAGEELHRALAAQILEGPLSEADGLVLDLRGGFGGANPEYLELFRRDLPALVFRGREGVERAPASSWTKPVVLLVDEGTTSGKEIFAHGFRRMERGQIVGSRTAGAVLGGRIFVLRDSSVLYLPVLDVRVDGERLEGRGVEPDVRIPSSRPFSGGRDPQLEAALAVLARS